MSLLWRTALRRTAAWAPHDSEESIHPSELEGRKMRSELNHGHVQRLADSIRQNGYSPEQHGQLGLNITDSGENIYHHADGAEKDPGDHLHHEHLLQALKDNGHDEVPVHIHDQRSDEDGDTAPKYYHGTTAEDVEEVRPNHSSSGNFGVGTHAQGYAYATSKDNALNYAERAAGHYGGHPHVYEVSPLGPVEKDPSHDEAGNSRANFADDVRSKHGFEVTGEEDTGHDEDDEEHEDW